MSIKKISTYFAVLLSASFSLDAFAAETTTYIYDAKGRVIKVVHTGSINNNIQTCYKIDKADNRTNVTANVGSLPSCP